MHTVHVFRRFNTIFDYFATWVISVLMQTFCLVEFRYSNKQSMKLASMSKCVSCSENELKTHLRASIITKKFRGPAPGPLRGRGIAPSLTLSRRRQMWRSHCYWFTKWPLLRRSRMHSFFCAQYCRILHIGNERIYNGAKKTISKFKTIRRTQVRNAWRPAAARRFRSLML